MSVRYTPHHALHPEIKYKKPHFQYNLHQECGFLYLISGCMPALTSPGRSDVGHPDRALRTDTIREVGTAHRVGQYRTSLGGQHSVKVSSYARSVQSSKWHPTLGQFSSRRCISTGDVVGNWLGVVGRKGCVPDPGGQQPRASETLTADTPPAGSSIP
eukprot:2771821-Rhodomonas_salina.4